MIEQTSPACQICGRSQPEHSAEEWTICENFRKAIPAERMDNFVLPQAAREDVEFLSELIAVQMIAAWEARL